MNLLATMVIFAACDDMSEQTDDPLIPELSGSDAPPTYSGPPSSDPSPPAEIAPGSCPRRMQNLPKVPYLTHLVADGEQLFATSGNPGDRETLIYRIDLDDGAQQVIARLPGMPRDLVVHGDDVIVATSTQPGTFAKVVNVHRMARNGSALKAMVSNEPLDGIGADDKDLYFFRAPEGGTDKLVRRSLATGAETLVRRRPAAPFVVDDEVVWVAGPEKDVVFARIDKDTGEEHVLARWSDVPGLQPLGPRSIFQDATHVYSAGPYDGFVLRLNKMTGGVSLVSKLVAPVNDAHRAEDALFSFGTADGGFLFHFETRLIGAPPYATQLNQLSLATGELITVTSARRELDVLSSDAGCLFFGDYGTDRESARNIPIRAFAKPRLTDIEIMR